MRIDLPYQPGVFVYSFIGDGQPLTIGQVDKSNPQAVRRWLEPLVRRLGMCVMVTDDLVSFRIAAEILEIKNQVCQFHSF